MNLSLNKKLQKSQDIVDSQIDNEVVMMHIDSGNYFGIDEIGSDIWRMLDEPLNPTEIVSKLTEKYNVGEEQCLQDITPFITKLVEAGLIVECG